MRWGKYGNQKKGSSFRSDLKAPFRINISIVFLFIATVMLFTNPLVINDAFANHLSDELKWQTVFISSDSACSNYHFQMMHTYNDVSLEYLKLYGMENNSYDPLCMTEKKYLSDYENPHDLDLLILVYDEDLGERELHANQLGGLYIQSGGDRSQNNVIIICDCSNFYYSSPVWILSHELSHFILYYKNFDMSVIESLIHVNDEKYDECLNESTTCESRSIKMVAGPGGYAHSVMPIYQPAVEAHIENEVITDVTKSPPSKISKIITIWWATGIISDEQYSKAIGYFVDSNVISSHDDTSLILADEPLENEKTWEQMMEEVTPTYWGSKPKNDDSMAYLLKIPSNMISKDKTLLSEEKKIGLPEWFKKTAELWGQDMITDKEFNKNIEYLVKEGIIDSHTSNVFQDLVVESESQDLVAESNEEKTIYTLPEWFVANAGWWSEGHVTDIEYNTAFEYLVNEGIIESHSKQILSINQNNDESLTKDLVSEVLSEALSDTSIESVNENDKNIQVDTEAIHELYDIVNSIPDIDDVVMMILLPVVNDFDEGNVADGCNKLGNLIILFENLIESNKIDQTLGQSLISASELIQIDLCD